VPEPLTQNVNLGIRTLSGASWSFLGSIADYLLSFALTILVARPLGPSEYGYIPLLAGITDMPRLVLVTTLGTSLAKHVATNRGGDSRGPSQVLKTGLVLIAVLSAAVGTLVFLGADLISEVFHQPELGGMVRIAAIALFANGLMSFVQSAFQGLDRLDLLAGSQLSSSSLRFVLTIWFFYGLGLRVQGVLWASALSYLLVSILFLIVVWRRWIQPGSGRQALPSPFRTLIAYASPLVVSSLAFYAYTRVDIVILGFYAHDRAEIGYLGLASTMFTVLLVVAQSIATAVFPAIAALVTSESWAKLQHLFDLVINWLFIYSVPSSIAAFALAGPFFAALAPEYMGAAVLLRLLSPLLILRSLGTVMAGGCLTPAGFAKDVAKLTTLAAIANVLLDLLLIPHYSALGSVIGTLIVHGGSAIAGVLLVRYRLPLTIRLPWEPLIGGAVMCVAIVSGIQLGFGNGLASMAVVALLGFVAYMGVMLASGGLWRNLVGIRGVAPG